MYKQLEILLDTFADSTLFWCRNMGQRLSSCPICHQKVYKFQL